MMSSVIDLTVTPWREAASCLEVTQQVNFFPAKEDVAGIAKAKAVCATCPVTDQCLSWSIVTNQIEGIWGGLTQKERRRVRRRWLEEIRRAS